MAAPTASRDEVRSADELSGSHTMVMGPSSDAPPSFAAAAPAAAPLPLAVQPVSAPNSPAIARAAPPTMKLRLLKNPFAMLLFLSCLRAPSRRMSVPSGAPAGPARLANCRQRR